MLRLAVLLLAGATFVAAQTTTTADSTVARGHDGPAIDSAMEQHTAIDSQRPERDSTTAEETYGVKDTAQHKGVIAIDSVIKIVDQLKQRFDQDNDNDSAEVANGKARDTVIEFRNHMRDTTKVVADSLLQQRKAEANVRIQGAIDAMTQKGDKVGTQVQEVRDRIQARIVEKRQELIDLQKTILDRQNARKTAKEETDTTTTTTAN
jgi:hypothetical protein